MSRKSVKWILGAGALVVGYVVFFVLSDVPGALTRMGPFAGQVVDTSSRRPVGAAYVFFNWGSDGIGGPVGCISSQVVRTDANGNYRSKWRGYRFFLALGLTGIAPANVSAVALNYRPWGLGKDGPAYPDNYNFVPANGWPFVARQVGTIKLASLRHATYSEKDWYRLDNCVGAHGQEEALIAYLRQRAEWRGAYCDSQRADPPTALDFQHFGEGFSDDTPVVSMDDQHPLPPGAQTIKGLRDHLGALLGFNPEMKDHPSSVTLLSKEQWTAACELADVRMPTFENVQE